MIRVVLPQRLRALARIEGEVELDAPAPTTLHDVLDALEARHPALRGTLRDPGSRRRRPLVRFFACREDISHEPLDRPLPEAIAAGTEPLLIVAAIAGG